MDSIRFIIIFAIKIFFQLTQLSPVLCVTHYSVNLYRKKMNYRRPERTGADCGFIQMEILFLFELMKDRASTFIMNSHDESIQTRFAVRSINYAISLVLLFFMLMKMAHQWNVNLAMPLRELLSKCTRHRCTPSRRFMVELHPPSTRTRNIIVNSNRPSITDSASFIFIAGLRFIYSQINA